MTELHQTQPDKSFAMFIFFVIAIVIYAVYVYRSFKKAKPCQHSHVVKRKIWSYVEADFCANCNQQISETNE